MFAEGKDTTVVLETLDLEYREIKKYYSEYLDLKNMSAFVNVLENYPGYLSFFVDIAERMKRGELFKEDIDFLLANLIYCRASLDRKMWLDHEIRCLELQKKCLEDELDENNGTFWKRE